MDKFKIWGVYVLVFIFTLSSSSCSSTYYYTQLSTPFQELSTRKANGDFVFENDSLWIGYMFGGENAPVNISIGNKQNKPLFIDWNKSALLIGNIRYLYNETKAPFLLQNLDSIYTSISQDAQYPSKAAGADIKILLPEGVDFIPPHHILIGTAAWINPDVREYNAHKSYTPHAILDKKRRKKTTQKLNFEENNSPLKFSSSITYYYDSNNIQTLFSDFYIKNVIKTSIDPQNMPAEWTNRGDIFYTRIAPDYSALQVVTIATVSAGVVVLDAAISK